MALKQWNGQASTVSQVDTVIIGSNTTGQTFSYTVNGKTYTYTALSSDTSTTILAASFQVFLSAVSEPEFQELKFTPSTNTVIVTGPADGAPFTGTVGGTGTISTSTTTAPLSPHDVGRAANWTGGVLPTTGDTVVFDLGSTDAKYNLAALAAVAIGSFTRRPTFTGVIGLPDINPFNGGYEEYRPTHFSLNTANIRVEQAATDLANQVRILSTLTGAPVTVTVVGQSAIGAGGSQGWPCDVYGLPSGQANVVNVTNGAVAVANLTGQTATVGTFRSASGTFLLGSAVTLTTATVVGGTGEIDCGFTTVTLDQSAVVVVSETAAAGTGVTAQNGAALSWQSTGTPGAVLIGNNATFDLSSCPAPVAVGTITRNAGSTLNDPLGRITRPYTEVYSNCGQESCTTVRGTGFQAVIS